MLEVVCAGLRGGGGDLLRGQVGRRPAGEEGVAPGDGGHVTPGLPESDGRHTVSVYTARFAHSRIRNLKSLPFLHFISLLLAQLCVE